jgi:copper chaperone NosL
MKTGARPRILMAIAALVMLGAFTAPLWSIHLTAPQYRDGLGMHISISEITGHDTHDIQNINILNHYIGMKPIEPDAIPEFAYMPWILAGLIVTGLLVAVVGHRWLMAAWLVAFLGLGIAGMVDFYLWNIDYGHNLSPDAPIKVPGMTYSPPLIGKKVILNITAWSYPHIGSAFLGLSIGLASWGVFGAYRKAPPQGAGSQESAPAGDDSERPTRPAGASRALPVAALAALVLISGCINGEASPAGEPALIAPGSQMAYGFHEDPYCGGLVETVRWGGELRTAAGDTLRFRSVECLAGYVASGAVAAADVAEVLVVDFPSATGLIPAGDALYLHTPNLASPARRGLNVMAIGTEKLALSLQDAYTGRLMGWEDVLATVTDAWDLDAANSGGMTR